ncbi:MAG: carbon-nitrogen hydrolase family protein [Gemmatimonadota bacterium]|nr:carbon-nitrogen hydrolase family protein [Gemmatimonadota bacterium]
MPLQKRGVRIGLLKAMPAKWNVEANWNVFEEQFARHLDSGLDVFVTPECFLDGYAVTEDDWNVARFGSVAQTVGESPFIRGVLDFAGSSNTHIVFGFTELKNGRFYNAALLAGRNGEIAGVYYKTHLQNHDRRFAAGTDLPVFELDFGTAGVAICADRRWPESIRVLRLKGARVCLLPTYGMWHLDNEWWMRTRSYENQMYICFAHPNVALITGPGGQLDAKLQSNVTDVLVHDIDLETVTDGNHLADRRPDLYGILSDETHPSRQDPLNPPTVDGEGGN